MGQTISQTKLCRKCSRLLPAESFNKNASVKDGLRPECKACQSAHKRAHYLANKAAITDYKRAYYLQNKEAVDTRSRAYYEANKESRDASSRAYNLANKESVDTHNRAYYQENKESISAYKRVYYQENKEELNAHNRAYKKAHPEVHVKARSKRRAQKLDNGIFEISSKEITRIRNSPCTFCNSTQGIHIDHIVPLSKGGAHSIGNLQPLCQSCNQAKSAKFYFEFKTIQLAGKDS